MQGSGPSGAEAGKRVASIASKCKTVALEFLPAGYLYRYLVNSLNLPNNAVRNLMYKPPPQKKIVSRHPNSPIDRKPPTHLFQAPHPHGLATCSLPVTPEEMSYPVCSKRSLPSLSFVWVQHART